jgi:hypothetical protein
MTESDQNKTNFAGVYFDRDVVIRLARWAGILSWVILALYLFSLLFSIGLFFAQYQFGLVAEKGMTFANLAVNLVMPYLLQAAPGVFYFFGLQAVSKALLILLDVEDNTRRAARK